MEAAAWDQLRNYGIVAWAIRKHISYVSQFNFKIRTPDRSVGHPQAYQLRESVQLQDPHPG
jgi:hypothetical protein